MEGMTSGPGTYAVLFRGRKAATIPIGRRSDIDVVPGYYVYIGSAFGPGGVRARVLRHCRREKKSRWHIDYLSQVLTPIGAWYSHSRERLEHRWAKCLGQIPELTAIADFGCSDCRCDSHLFHSTTMPSLDLGANVGYWQAID